MTAVRRLPCLPACPCTVEALPRVTGGYTSPDRRTLEEIGRSLPMRARLLAAVGTRPYGPTLAFCALAGGLSVSHATYTWNRALCVFVLRHLPVGVAAAAGNPAYLPLVSPPSIAAAVAATTAAAWHEALSSPDAAAAVLGATSGVPAIAWRAYAVRVADTRPLPRNGADLPSWAEAVWTTAMTAGGGAWNHADRGPELAALTRCPRATELYLCAAVLMVAVGGGMVWGGDLTLLSAKLRAELAGVPPPRPNMFVRPMEYALWYATPATRFGAPVLPPLALVVAAPWRYYDLLDEDALVGIVAEVAPEFGLLCAAAERDPAAIAVVYSAAREEVLRMTQRTLPAARPSAGCPCGGPGGGRPWHGDTPTHIAWRAACGVLELRARGGAHTYVCVCGVEVSVGRHVLHEASGAHVAWLRTAADGGVSATPDATTQETSCRDIVVLVTRSL